MSAYRTVPATRGAAWIVDAVAGLRRAPGAYLGACVFVALLISMPVFGAVLGVLLPVFHGGLLSLLRTRAEGGTGRANQAFAGFTEPGAMRRLWPIVLFKLAFALLVGAVVWTTAGASLVALAEATQAGAQPTPAQVAALLGQLLPPLLWLSPLGLFVSWMLMLAIPRAMLGGVPGGVALREAAGAVWANLGAFLVNLACLLALGFALALVLVVPLAIVGALQATAPGMGMLLQVLMVTGVTAAVLALDAAMTFQCAREVFVVTDAAPPPSADVIEA
ncbi:MAG: hypothetical protein ACREO3_00280 [Arenimonas sp.]